jgi:hypothetical protein
MPLVAPVTMQTLSFSRAMEASSLRLGVERR